MNSIPALTPKLLIDPPKCGTCGKPCGRQPNVDICEMCGAKVHTVPPKRVEYSKSCGLFHFMKCPGAPGIPDHLRSF